jgi:hypothetical protein
MGFADSASCRHSHYVVVARTLDTDSETKRPFNAPYSRNYATGYSRASPVPSRYSPRPCSDMPLLFERQVSVNQFKIGAVGKRAFRYQSLLSEFERIVPTGWSS